MAPAKRKANTAADVAGTVATKRLKRVVEPTASSSRPSRTSLAVAAAPRSTRSSISGKPTPVKPAKNTVKDPLNGTAKESATKTATKVKATDSRKRGRPAKTTTSKEEAAAPEGTSILLVDVPLREKPAVNGEAEEEAETNSGGPAYWLMKAEPESRIEKGKDVKFSIDDLKAASKPEGWDETAFDPEHPYFDEKSDREKPKWCLVHVKFAQKFTKMIKLKELQKYAKDGGVLENMQVLKQTRLSVSKVAKKEWDFIMDLIDVEDIAAMSAAHQPQMTV
ncbi:MAG: hypothetical protein Q9161_006896 [Pseudevernia consocians]